MAAHDLTLTRIIHAQRDLVFRAFIDEKLIAQWWGPEGFTNPVSKVDAHPGGAIRIDMRGPDGEVYPMKGQFVEIVPPERLVFTTSAFEDAAGVPGLEDRTTVTFADKDGATTLTVQAEVTKAAEGTEEALAGMEDGWRQSLDRLEATLQGCEDSDASTVFTAEPGKKEVVVTAKINASREQVFRAFTDPTLIPLWWGPLVYKTTVDKLEAKPGGTWRYVQTSSDGSIDAFHGEYRSINAPECISYTFEWEGLPGHVSLETISLEEVNGKTTVIDRTEFNTQEDRDGMVEYGMESGATESMKRLANLWRNCYLGESAPA